MLKKILILSSILSFNLYAKCPNLEGTYQCLNYQGQSYTQDITISKAKGGIVYTFKKNNEALSFIVDGSQHLNEINVAGQKMKMLYRGTCQKHTYINEFYFDDKVSVARGNSKFYRTPEGYIQENTVIFTNDSKKTSTEECRKIK